MQQLSRASLPEGRSSRDRKDGSETYPPHLSERLEGTQVNLRYGVMLLFPPQSQQGTSTKLLGSLVQLGLLVSLADNVPRPSQRWHAQSGIRNTSTPVMAKNVRRLKSIVPEKLLLTRSSRLSIWPQEKSTRPLCTWMPGGGS